MLKRFAQLAGLTLLLGMVFVPTARADTHFSIRIGPSVPYGRVAVPYGRAAVPSVRRLGYVWQPGYYVRSVYGRRWIPGAWVPAPYARGGWGTAQWGRFNNQRYVDSRVNGRYFQGRR